MNDTTLPKQSNDSKYPRRRENKGAVVRPGFGLHDWMTLLRQAKDLAQRKGSPLRHDITPAEMRLHDKPYDGWCSLRGKVYNISPYLAYHPGGDEILRSVLGKDATALFDKYHQWINIDNLIGPLLLGTLMAKKRRSSVPEDGGASEYDEDGDDGDDGDDPVMPSMANSHASNAIPMPRPIKVETAASLLPPLHKDGDADDPDEYSPKI
ncbi:hypothetical protein ACHAXA_010752 [Cyclostephanos tholiformis]|uniref:Cytochrome b5 heme-binding domain-containing protein n=1 Tax=Cyclostephanos tholiformis TaxID=382380 RepID=A0ABD3RSH5_9STRA